MLDHLEGGEVDEEVEVEIVPTWNNTLASEGNQVSSRVDIDRIECKIN